MLWATAVSADAATRSHELGEAGSIRFFQPHRAPRSDDAKALVEDVLIQLQSFERLYKKRKRARKAIDQEIFEETVTAVICDVIHRHLEDANGAVAVRLSNRLLGTSSRYRPRALGKKLPALLEELSEPEMAFLEMTKGGRELVWEEAEEGGEDRIYYKGKATEIRAGHRLVRRIEDYGIGFDDLKRLSTAEVIILKGPKVGNRDGERLEYDDTRQTARWRSEMREINGSWKMPTSGSHDDDDDHPVDLSQRQLRRVFNNGSFNQGGRLFGGFWMELKKERRREDLRIGGLAIAELDYGQMALRLLYGMRGATPPEGDLYAIPGIGPLASRCSGRAPRP